jgi:hypothetical protein
MIPLTLSPLAVILLYAGWERELKRIVKFDFNDMVITLAPKGATDEEVAAAGYTKIEEKPARRRRTKKL